MHKPVPGLSQLEHNLNSLCVSTRTQSRSLWEAGALVPPRSPSFLREAGKTKAGGNEHIQSFGDGPVVSANLSFIPACEWDVSEPNQTAGAAAGTRTGSHGV